MVVDINIEAQQNTAGFTYFDEQSALSVYRSVISRPCSKRVSDQNRLTSPMLLVKRCKQWPAVYTRLAV